MTGGGGVPPDAWLDFTKGTVHTNDSTSGAPRSTVPRGGQTTSTIVIGLLVLLVAAVVLIWAALF